MLPVGFDRHDNAYYHFGDERIYRAADVSASGKSQPKPSKWELVSKIEIRLTFFVDT